MISGSPNSQLIYKQISGIVFSTNMNFFVTLKLSFHYCNSASLLTSKWVKRLKGGKNMGLSEREANGRALTMATDTKRRGGAE